MIDPTSGELMQPSGFRRALRNAAQPVDGFDAIAEMLADLVTCDGQETVEEFRTRWNVGEDTRG